MVTSKQLEQQTRRQLRIFSKLRNIPPEGIEVDYMGKKFIVYPNTFIPTYDTIPLLENWHITPGEFVLDVCTGSGVIPIFAKYAGARKVVAVDINPDAVKTAIANAKLHDFEDSIDVRLSNLFDALRNNEKFDVITANPPWRNLAAKDYVEASMWDTDPKNEQTIFC